MKKGIFALLAIFALVASFAAAPNIQDTANGKVVPSQANAFGLAADKQQCTCSADTLAKITQIKKLLAELETSCMIVENPGRGPVAVGCVDKCLADQNVNDYCKSNCLRDGVLDNACFDGCYAGIKQKCENSCNIPAVEQKPYQPGCAEQCFAKKHDKKACLDTCGAPGTASYDLCYNDCSKKAGIIWDACQKECNGQSVPVSTEAPDVLGQCSGSCEVKYADCKNNCYAISGSDAVKLETCVKAQCVPVLDQCSTSCNSQYGKAQGVIAKIVNVFKPGLNQGAKWQCYDGTWGDASGVCLSSSDLQAKAKAFCDGKCSAETNKCGVNTFMAYGEC